MVSECEIPAAQLLTEKPDRALARPGVYAILCDANGRYYVGSSKNMATRCSQHILGLKSGLHFNPKLRYSYNKHGASRHLFRVLEFCPIESLHDVERKWMTELDSVKSGFNVAEDPLPRLNKKMTPEQRANLSKTMIAANAVNGRGMPYNLVSPNGDIYSGNNVNAFCRSMGMNRSDSNSITQVINGESISHKGWRAVGGRNRKLRVDKPFCFVPPPGTLIRGSNLRVFCDDNGLDYGMMGKLCRGESLSHHGWRLAGDAEPVTKKTFRKSVERAILSPNGDEVRFRNMAEFCRNNKLSQCAVNLVLSGKRPHHKGWRKQTCS